MKTLISRRALLTGALSLAAGAALADAPTIALRPPSRPGSVVPPSGAEILARAGLSGEAGFALVDADTGEILESHGGAHAMTPASVTKSFTALYALDRLGADFTFATRLIATGPVVDGALQGDLVLAGGGDPRLTTDDLAELARRLRAAGVTRVSGGYRLWGGALPNLHEIDPGQLSHLGYNPAIGGLNLNFNRVHFEWAPRGGDYRVTMDARSDLYRPEVTMARMQVAVRDLPVYTYADQDGVDAWTVARSALGDGGSRWLPVRRPAQYAGQVFRHFALAQGIELPEGQEVEALPAGEAIARFDSPALEVMIRDMLDFSTNITAEALGLTASRAGGGNPATLAESAGMMRDWLRAAHGVSAHFADHSGLGDGTSVSPVETVAFLTAAARAGALPRLMKDIAMTDEQGDRLARPPAVIRAKTGTLNFVSALAGYEVMPGGRRLAFAIYTADPEKRAAARASGEEAPAGVRSWARDSRRLQQRLLRGWAARHP